MMIVEVLKASMYTLNYSLNIQVLFTIARCESRGGPQNLGTRLVVQVIFIPTGRVPYLPQVTLRWSTSSTAYRPGVSSNPATLPSTLLLPPPVVLLHRLFQNFGALPPTTDLVTISTVPMSERSLGPGGSTSTGQHQVYYGGPPGGLKLCIYNLHTNC